MKSVVIAGYARSPFHFAGKGELAKTRPDDLATQVISALLSRSGVKPDDIEDVILGCAFPEGEQGMNMARLVSMMAKIPLSAGGTTVNRFCGSSMQAIHMAAGAIQMNAGDVFICGGVESMTRIPLGGYNFLPHPGLMKDHPEAFTAMGITAENLATKYGISRKDQQELTILSHQRAELARSTGKLDDEMVTITSKSSVIKADGCIRPGTSHESLDALKPSFLESGTVTAGTSSPLTDGAAATLVTSEDYAKAHNLPILARIKSIAISGCAPEIMGIGPVSATQKALQRAGLTLKDIDIIELNEAFAAQSLAVVRELGIDLVKMNIDGGALALGHPLGATGARITGKAAALLKREGKQFALATQCIGGGQGIATILEAV